MPRRGNVAKRDVLADPIYNSKLVTRLVNSIMLDGKKGVAQKIVYEAFETVKEKTGNDPLETFEKAMENIMPSLEVKARRVGGSTYQVPIEVRAERRQKGRHMDPRHTQTVDRADHCAKRDRRQHGQRNAADIAHDQRRNQRRDGNH